MWWESEGHLTVEDNKLQIAGRSVVDLVAEHRTPVYFYNLNRIRRRFERMQRALTSSLLEGSEIKFAMKANNNPTVLEILADCGAGIDATSPNEVVRARKAGFGDESIIFTGTMLSDDDLSFLREADVLVNFDSVSSLRRFNAGPSREVGLRINSGVGLGRSKKTTTGGKVTDSAHETGESTGHDNGIPVKFGIPHDDDGLLEQAFDIVERHEYTLSCIHHHVGSGWLADQALDQDENYLTAVQNTLHVAERATDRGHDVSILDLGGGFGVRQAEDEDELPLERLFDLIARQIEDSSVSFDQVFLEPGAFLVSDAGIFVTKVNTVERKGGRTFVGVNAGLNSFNSFAHYDYYHEVVNCSSVVDESGTQESVVVAGNNCESGDLFTEERTLPTTVSEGDYLALLNAGAYGAVFRSDFNLREPASEIPV